MIRSMFAAILFVVAGAAHAQNAPAPVAPPPNPPVADDAMTGADLVAPDASEDPLAPLQAEVAELRAREEIRELLHAYGRSIDTRDFDGFAGLWTDEAAYIGGANSGPLTGGAAIAEFMEGVFADNPSGLGEPNAHVFFNEFIEVDGDRATGTSMGAFVTTAANGPVISILARYNDEYVLENGRWKFARRVVQGFSNDAAD